MRWLVTVAYLVAAALGARLRTRYGMEGHPLKPTLSFVMLYVAFDRLAAMLGSTRGEAGLAVCAVVLALVLAVEHLLTRARLRDCVRALGLGAPATRALVCAAVMSLALLACLPLLAALTNVELELRANAAWLALGMLAQGGVAEEVLFRGFMYRHLRETRAFWPAATLSAVPFAAAHVALLWSLELSVALLALAMAIAWSFPLAWLFDRARNSIWPGAILHAVMQGGIKVLVDDDAAFQSLAIAWVALGLLAPWLFFAVLRETAQSTSKPGSLPSSDARPAR
jgi:membrane protease YdiL (CAAX protease family)